MSAKHSGSNEIVLYPSKPPVQDRPLISEGQASELEGLFKLLCKSMRLRMIHALVKSGLLSLTDLAQAVEMKSQAVSNQLQRLVDRGVLASKRNGNKVHYRIVDPCVINPLDRGLCRVEDAKERAPHRAKTVPIETSA